MPERTKVTGLPATRGGLVVEELVDDALLTLRDCIVTVASTTDLDRQTMIGFIHYVFARPISMSKCSKADADHILAGLLDALMSTTQGLDLAGTKRAISLTHRLLSGGDPATIHIRISTAAFLQAMKNGGCEVTDDDSKLRLMLLRVESLQVEVKIFLNAVLDRYLLDWTKDSDVLTEAEHGQRVVIAELRHMVREEAARIQGA